MYSALKLFFVLLILISNLNPSTSLNCTTDSDCSNLNTPYCFSGQCTLLVSTGEFCQQHTDCASFPYLGETACTGICGIEATCSIQRANSNSLAPRNTKFCCLGAEANSTCQLDREAKKLRACKEGLKCEKSDVLENISTCQEIGTGNRWIIGVAVSVLGSITLNVGINIQKYAFKGLENIPEDQHVPLYKMPLWLLGFAIWIIGNLANFVALSFAAQSLIAPLGAVSLLSNAVAAPLINKEPIGKFDLIAIIFIIAGSVVVVVFSSRESPEYSLCALLSFYSRTGTIVYLVVMCALLFVLWLFIRIMESNQRRIRAAALSVIKSNPTSPVDVEAAPKDEAKPWIPVLHIGLDKYTVKLKEYRIFSPSSWFKIETLEVKENGFAMKYLLPFSYACCGGVMGGMTVLFAKSAAELISTTLGGDNQFIYVPTYFILLAIVVTGIGQVYYINAGIKHYDALLQVPVFYVVYTICGVVSGGVYFDEFRKFSAVQFLLFCFGILLTFVGVACLAGRLKEEAAKEAEKARLEEEKKKEAKKKEKEKEGSATSVSKQPRSQAAEKSNESPYTPSPPASISSPDQISPVPKNSIKLHQFGALSADGIADSIVTQHPSNVPDSSTISKSTVQSQSSQLNSNSKSNTSISERPNDTKPSASSSSSIERSSSLQRKIPSLSTKRSASLSSPENVPPNQPLETPTDALSPTSPFTADDESALFKRTDNPESPTST